MANFWEKIGMATCRWTRAFFGAILLCGVFLVPSTSFAESPACTSVVKYTSCVSGRYLEYNGSCDASSPHVGNECASCPSGCTCSGGTNCPVCGVTVSFNLNGGSGSAPSSTDCTNGSSCTVITTNERTGATTSFYRAGYVFTGWYTSTSGGTQLTSNSVTVTSNTVYYARWTACAKGTYKSSSAQASASCSTASNGYYVSTTGASSQTQCPSGYRDGSDGGRDAITDCYKNVTRGCTQNNGSVPNGCASVTSWNSCSCSGGTYKQYTNSAGTGNGTTSGTTSNETCTKTPAAVSADENHYVDGTSCPACSSQDGGAFPYSDGGNHGYNYCYRACVASDVTGAASVQSGGVRYSDNSGNTCKAASCNANRYLSSGSCPTCSSKSSTYPYSDGGTNGYTYCYRELTNTGSQVEPALPSGCDSQTTTACTPGTCTYRDYNGATDTTCTPTNCTKTRTAVSADENHYVDGTSCPACSSQDGGAYPYSEGGNHDYNWCYRDCVASDVTGAASIQSGGKRYSDNSGNTCKAASCNADRYLSSGSCPTCSSKSSTYPHSDGGTNGYTYCYRELTNTGSQLEPSLPTGCASQTVAASCTPGTCTYRDYNGATDTTCTPTDCTKARTGVTASSGYYASSTATSCTQCPSGFRAGSEGNRTANTDCYANITLNKNGFSGTLTAGTGCTVEGKTGTTSDILHFHYNTACTLPATTPLSATGYSTPDGWATSNTMGASKVTSIAKRTSAPTTTTYYARKVSCAAGYYKSSSSCSACGANSSTGAENTSTTCTCTSGYTADGTPSGATTSTSGCSAIKNTITLNDNGGSGGSGTIYTTYATNVYTDSNRTNAMTTSANAVTKPSKTGYTFNGYYNSATGSTQYIDANGYITSSGLTAGKAITTTAGTWYAKWTANTNTITLNKNGGSGALKNNAGTSYTTTTNGSMTCSSDATNVALPTWASSTTNNNTTSMTKSGAIFLGWSTSNTCTSSDCASTSITCPTANTTYYAVWSACTCGTDTKATCSVQTVSANTCQYKHTCTSGYYNASNTDVISSNTMTCSECGSGKYCPSGAKSPSNCSSLGGGLFTSTASTTSSANTQCYVTTTAGKWIETSNDTALKTCTAGYYCPGNIKVYYTGAPGGSRVACGDGTFSAAGATACTACATGSYSAAASASTSCVACPGGRTTSGTGTHYNATANTACSVTCSNSSNVATWTAPSWASNSVSNLCSIATCATNYTRTGSTGTSSSYVCTPNVIASASDKTLTYNGTTTSNGTAQSCANVTVTTPSSGATVKYSTTSNGTFSEDAPTLTAVGSTPVYYQVSANGYVTKTGSYTCTMNAKAMTVSASNKSKTYDGTALTCNVSVSVPSSGATIKYRTASSGDYNLTTAPTVTNVADTKTVYYQVTGANFTTKTGSFTCTITKANCGVTLSKSSDTTNFPTTKTFTASTASGCSLSVSPTSGDVVATAAISSGTVTVTPKKTGSQTVTVTATADGNHNNSTATYTLTVNNGTISATVAGNSKTYNGSALTCNGGITGLTPSDATITYATKSGSTCGTYGSAPSRTDAGTTTVCYKISKTYYTDKTGEFSCTVNRAAGTTTIKDGSNAVTSGSISYPSTKTLSVTCSESGTLGNVTSGTTAVATVAKSGNNFTITPVKAGTSTITANCPQTTNYNASSGTYALTVNKGDCPISVNPTSGSGTCASTTATFTISKGDHNGTLSAASSATGVATVALSGTGNTTGTVTRKSAGSATITVTAAATDQCNAATATYTFSGNKVTGSTTIKDGGTTASSGSTTYGTNKTLTVTCAGGATPSISNSGTTSVATATISSGTITMTPVKAGESTITVSCPATDCYNASTATYKLTVSRANCSITLTPTSGTITYPTTTSTFNINWGNCNGTKSISSNATGTATAALASNNASATVTWVAAGSGNNTASATITVKSAQSDQYDAATATYTATTAKGTGSTTLSSTSSTLTYNGTSAASTTSTFTAKCADGVKPTATSSNTNAATVAVSSSADASGNYTITNTWVGAGSGDNNATTTITVSCAAGTHYKSSNATHTLTTAKKANTLTLSASSGTVTYPEASKTFTVSTNTSGGTLSVTSGTTAVATASLSGTTVTMTPKKSGTSTITVTSAATNYYKSATANYTLTVADKTITINKNNGTGSCGGATGTTAGSMTCTYAANTCTAPTWDSNCNITNGSGTSQKILTGWTANSTSGTAVALGGDAKNVTSLYAKWEDVSCSITNGSATHTVSNNTPTCAVTCTNGYSQSGYTNTTTTFNKTGTANNKSVSASCVARTYKVTLDPKRYASTSDNTGTAATTAGTAAYWYRYKTKSPCYYYSKELASASDEVAANCIAGTDGITITPPTSTGFTFAGYYTVKTGTSGTSYVNSSGGTINNIYSTVAANTTLYARWENTVTLNKNGGSGTIHGVSGTGNATVTCVYGAPSCTLGSASGLTQTGYTFHGGWSYNTDACTQTATGYLNPTGTLYACKTANVSGAITLDSKYYASSSATSGTNAGTNAAPTPLYSKYATGIYSDSAATTAVTKLTTIPAYTTYVFGGFYTGKAGSGTQVIDASGNILDAAKTAVAATGGTTTWYAKWTACSCGTDSNATCTVQTTSGNVCQYKHTCTTGYYNTDNSKTVTASTMTCTVCPAGSFCPAGATKSTLCAAGSYTASTGQSACTACQNGTTNTGASATTQKTCGTTCSNSANVRANSDGWETASWTNNSVTKACTVKTTGCNANYYYNSNACTACPAPADHKRTTFPDNYYATTITSTGPSNSAGTTAITGCQALTWISGPRGILYEYAKYNSTSGKYDNSTSNYGWADVNAGYYLTTKGSCGAFAYYKDALVCPEGSYCPGKTRVSCSPSNQSTVHTTTFGLESCPSNYANSAEGSDDINDCYLTLTKGNYVATVGGGAVTCACGGYCDSTANIYYGGSVSGRATTGGRTGCGAGKYNANTGSQASSACSTAAAGYYANSSCSQTACAAGKYSTGGASSCSDINAGYFCAGGGKTATPSSTSDSATGKACGNCASSNGSNGRPQYSAKGASSCSECPAVPSSLSSRVTSYGYYPAVHSNGVNGCYANFTDTDDTATFSTLCYHGSGDYGDTNSSCQTYKPSWCAAGKYSTIETLSGWSDAGQYVGHKKLDALNGQICTTTTAGYFSPEGPTVQTKCVAGTYSAAGASGCTVCGAGKTSTAGATSASACTNCSGITNLSSWATPTWDYSYTAPTLSNSATNVCTVDKCVAGSYKSSNTCPTCATNTYSTVGASSCTACTTAKGYGNSGTAASAHAGAASCKVTCPGGQYVATPGAGCVNVGAGNWCAGGTVAQTATLARTACASGLTTIGYGNGADEAGDCGRILHAGGGTLYLRSVKKTDPALHVKVDGTVFYGNMSTSVKNMSDGVSKKLKIKNGNTTYHVFDDSVN